MDSYSRHGIKRRFGLSPRTWIIKPDSNRGTVRNCHVYFVFYSCFIIVSISAAIISLCGIRHHEIVTSMTKSRITWIKDVRELITDFCIQFYFLPNEKAQLERLRMHIFLYLRECNEFYTPLIKAINVCCDNHIGEKDVAVVLQDLVAASQYVLATAWARVKLEGAHGMSDDKRIDKQLKKKYTVPQPNYCPDNQKTNQ